MAIVNWLFALILDVLRAAITKNLADEVKEWIPWVSGRLLNRAVARLPGDLRTRFEEEWSAHLADIPGSFAKLVTAASFCIAAERMRRIRAAAWSVPDAIKRAVEIIVTAVMIVAVAPVLGLISLAIKLDDNGPILIGCIRAGINGRNFTMYRFRTSGRIGVFLGRSGISHIPVLLNVLRGDMAYIGPRPMDQALIEMFTQHIPNYRERLSVRPGMTGLAMVDLKYLEFNPAGEFERDLYYIRNRSFHLNLTILFRSIRVALLGSGSFY